MQDEQPRIKAEDYKSDFRTWAEAIIRLNKIDGRNLIEGVAVYDYRQGASYAHLLPDLLTKLETLDLGPVEAPIQDYCDKMISWFHEIEKQETKSNHLRMGISGITTDVMKSDLLGRLIYGGESLRTHPCPIHKGHWAGLSGDWNGGCEAGCDMTGWLPNNTDIGQMMSERRKRAIERAKKFVAENPTSPFTRTDDPEAHWIAWKEKEAASLKISPAELGLKRPNRPTNKETKKEMFWQSIDVDKLEAYLEKNWTKLSEYNDGKRSWWRYNHNSIAEEPGETYYMAPTEIDEKDCLNIISVPTSTIKGSAYAKAMRDVFKDISNIQGVWLHDLLHEGQDMGTRPSDLRSEEFLNSITPEMFETYLEKQGWKMLGDDGSGNHVWQHEQLPKIYQDTWRSPPGTRYLSAIMINSDLDFDPNRAVKVVTHTNYADYSTCVAALIEDLHRHEDRERCSIVDDILTHSIT